MASTTPSIYMSLPIPGVGIDASPDWAYHVDNCLTIIDSHDHSAGKGVSITPAGLSINTDLPINGNNLTLVRAVRFNSQSVPIPGVTPDGNCIYVAAGELWYNDHNGAEVQLTNNGSVAGTTGSISGLTPPASASYNSGTFVWQSNSNTPANLDAASLIIRNMTAGSNGITLAAPNALAANYALTLPAALPGSSGVFLTLNTSGAMSYTSINPSQLEISGGVLQITAQGVGTSQIADGAITTVKIAGNAVTDAKIQSGGLNTGSFAAGSITDAKIQSGGLNSVSYANLSVTYDKTSLRANAGVVASATGQFCITSANLTFTSTAFPGTGNACAVQPYTSSNPMVIKLIPNGTSAPGNISVPAGATFTARLLRAGTEVGRLAFSNQSGLSEAFPLSAVEFWDFPGPTAGVNYTMQFIISSGTASISNAYMIAIEQR